MAEIPHQKVKEEENRKAVKEYEAINIDKLKIEADQLNTSLIDPLDVRGQKTEVFNVRNKRASCKLSKSND